VTRCLRKEALDKFTEQSLSDKCCNWEAQVLTQHEIGS
jgi:hypothetical protein